MKYLGEPRSGSAADVTWSVNQAGQYQRSRNGRGGTGDPDWTSLVANWQTLTDAQRRLWYDQAVTVASIGKRIASRGALSGFNLYLKVNMTIHNEFGPFIVDEPVDLQDPGDVYGEAISLEASFSLAAGELEYSWDFTGEEGTFQLRSSGVVTPGTFSPPGKGKWWTRFWGNSWGALTPQPASDLGAWVGTFGAPSLGDVFFVEARNVTRWAYFSNARLLARVVVAA